MPPRTDGHDGTAGTAGTAGIDPATALVAEQPGCYRLERPLTFGTAAALQPAFAAVLAAASQGELRIDLSRVQRVDSAGLALLIDWLAAARAHGRTLRYAAAPEALRALARLSDVEALLG